jgi:surface polysaccharide O-acyltransferase-like enzyme
VAEPPDTLQTIEDGIRRAEELTASAAGGSSDALLVQERSAARSHATRVIVIVYALVMVATALFIIASGFLAGDFKEAIAELLDFIKTALIPVVTFVVGHYFGASNR